MLQQTQVATVIAYYDRFLKRFPDVASLAAASLDEVLALWSGLGYYRRARMLHACAQQVVSRFGGCFPGDSVTLATLPGIGRSTAAAIAAFCFGERSAILDGNVKRVLSRAFGVGDDLAGASGMRQMWALAQSLMPVDGVEAYTQGLMDLGARVCTTRSPACDRCPLAGSCQARAEGHPEAYPVKSRRLRRHRRASDLLWLTHRDRVWLVPRPDKGVWAGLWCFPELANTRTDESAEPLERPPTSSAWPTRLASVINARVAGEHASASMGGEHTSPLMGGEEVSLSTGGEEAGPPSWPGQGQWSEPVDHVLTHFDWRLRPLRWTFPDDADSSQLALCVARWPEGRWFTEVQALALGLPAPIRRWLETA
jgi:A/G-specific adenine glycosylase